MPAGDLDNTFGTGGIVITQFPGVGTNGSLINSVSIQGDGKIVAGGYVDLGSGSSNQDFALARYSTLGVPDGTFGASGLVTTDLGTADDEIYGVAIQGDGKIVAAGFSGVAAAQRFAVARYNTNGSLDTAGFGSPNGYVITDVSGASKESGAQAVAIQGDGKIVAAGYATIGTKFDFALVRYNTDGTLDGAFGTSGIVTTSFGGSLDQSFAVHIQADGQIIAAGRHGSSTVGFAAARYNAADGSPDSGFGTSGKVTLDLSSTDEAHGIDVGSGGSITIAGFSDVGDTADEFAVLQYSSAGVLNTGSFGSPNGYVLTAFDGAGEGFAYALKIQGDGKIVVVGFTGSTSTFAVARYNTDGTLDATFGTGGKVVTAIGTKDDEAFSVAIQGDGKIVVGGYSKDSGNIRRFALARYLGAGGGGGGGPGGYLPILGCGA